MPQALISLTISDGLKFTERFSVKRSKFIRQKFIRQTGQGLWKTGFHGKVSRLLDLEQIPQILVGGLCVFVGE